MEDGDGDGTPAVGSRWLREKASDLRPGLH